MHLVTAFFLDFALPKFICLLFLHFTLHLWILPFPFLESEQSITNLESVLIGFVLHVLQAPISLFQLMIGSGHSGPGFEWCLHLTVRVPP